MAGTPVPIHVGDIIQTRKAHPCGGDTWAVVRIGAEIGIRCTTCDRKVFLPRSVLERRIRRFVSHAAVPPEHPPEEAPPE